MPTTTPPRNSLGANIRKARKAAEITQLTLAHQIGYKGHDAGAYISRVESDTQEPRLENLAKIAVALKVSLETLIQG